MLTPDEGFLDRRIVHEAGSLATRGWDVDIFPVVDAGLAYGDVLPTGVRLLASPQEARPTSRPKRMLQTMRRRLAPVAPALDRTVERVRYRLTDRARALTAANEAALISAGPYDLVFAHDVPVFPLASGLAARWRAPLVCDLHEIFPEQDEHFTTDTARRYWRSVERQGIGAAASILVVNRAVADYVHRTYAPSVPVEVVHNSMPFVPRTALDGLTIRDVYPIPPDRRVMVFAGSLRPYANLETVIAGFDRAGLDEWVLALLGSGPLRDELLRLVRRNHLEERVYIGERADQAQLLQAVSSADMGVLPYQAVGINHTIATPNKLFEYMQARVPIATTRLPMIEEMLQGAGVSGFVDFSDERATGEGLRRFVGETLPSIDQQALEAAAVRYSWEREEDAFFAAVDAAMSAAAR